jgi:uncharacterized protein
MTTFDRRTMLKLSGMGTLVLALGGWRGGSATAAVVGAGPYGSLGDADPHGVRLPAGFTARLVARTGDSVGSTGFGWVGQPDGAATFATGDGGWIYVANSEVNGTGGGAAAIRFASDGTVVDAYRILGGTKWNCSGGATPWGTWLSCEEHRQGRVWECDPTGPGQGVARPLLGTFAHEAAVVDPLTGWVYMTEDDADGRLYRFRPHTRGDLRTGVLEAARVSASGSSVAWVEVSARVPERSRLTTAFDRGEGAWFAHGRVWFTTTGDDRVWALTPATGAIEIVYDAAALGPDAPLRDPDCLTVHPSSRDVFVGEDADDLQLVVLAGVAEQGGELVAAPFLQLVGHGGGENGAPGQDGENVPSASWAKTSELAGLAFSPDGTRLYCTSQRGTDGERGMTFEVRGPFRR